MYTADYRTKAGLWLRHCRQMPRAYEVKRAYKRYCCKIFRTYITKSVINGSCTV